MLWNISIHFSNVLEYKRLSAQELQKLAQDEWKMNRGFVDLFSQQAGCTVLLATFQLTLCIGGLQLWKGVLLDKLLSCSKFLRTKSTSTMTDLTPEKSPPPEPILHPFNTLWACCRLSEVRKMATQNLFTKKSWIAVES